MSMGTTPQPGTIDVPGPGVYHDGMELLTDPANLPKTRGKADARKIPDETLINIPVWAALQGVAVATVHRNRAMAEQRRKAGDYKLGDMPAEDSKVGQSPLWSMRTYREWEPTRPGKGKGGGPKPGRARPRPKRHARLPIEVTCPCGCGEVIKITARDVADGKVKTGDSRRVEVPAVAEQAPAGELVSAG